MGGGEAERVSLLEHDSLLLPRAKHNGEKTVAGDGIDIKSRIEARSRELLTEIWKVYA